MRVMPRVTLSAPGRSKVRSLFAWPSRGIRTKASSSAGPARATLTKNTASQPNARVRRPPSSTPMTSPAAPGTAPDAQRAIAGGPFGEGGVDERQGGGEDEGSTEALDRAGGEQDAGAGRESPGERRPGIEGEAGGQDAASPEQVGGATAEQEEAGRGYRVGADDRLKCLRGVAEVACDVGQCHDHDVLVEGNDQHGEGQKRQRRCLAVPAEAAGRGGCLIGSHSSTPDGRSSRLIQPAGCPAGSGSILVESRHSARPYTAHLRGTEHSERRGYQVLQILVTVRSQALMPSSRSGSSAHP